MLPESLLPPAATQRWRRQLLLVPEGRRVRPRHPHHQKGHESDDPPRDGEDDVGEIRRLIVGLALYEKEPASTVEVTEDELRRDGFGAQPVFRCLLAEVESVAIGFALFFYNYSTWQGRCIYLEDLYVEESGAARARARYY